MQKYYARHFYKSHKIIFSSIRPNSSECEFLPKEQFWMTPSWLQVQLWQQGRLGLYERVENIRKFIVREKYQHRLSYHKCLRNIEYYNVVGNYLSVNTLKLILAKLYLKLMAFYQDFANIYLSSDILEEIAGKVEANVKEFRMNWDNYKSYNTTSTIKILDKHFQKKNDLYDRMKLLNRIQYYS